MATAFRRTTARRIAALAVLLVLAGAPERAASQQATFVVTERQIDDLKSVFATVRSKKVVEARVRTPGTIASLRIGEGMHVEPGQVLGVVADPKIALRIKASDAQVVALESRVATARADLERTAELQRRGVVPQARLDQSRTAFDVAANELAAARAERAVIERQLEEGEILAPSAGRVLRVPVTEGSVVLAGESIASIAANEYLLRLEVPERHARFMMAGDPVRVGRRGLGPDHAPIAQGRIVQVYPELQAGRVIADAEVAQLGDYFVGERALVWISAGKRSAILVPRDHVFSRFGLDFVRLRQGEQATIDVVVQLAATTEHDEARALVEALSGVQPGDRLVRP